MKKVLPLLLVSILSCSLYPMHSRLTQSTLLRIPRTGSTQNVLYSISSQTHRPLTLLSQKEVQRLVHNTKEAQAAFKFALFRYEDTQTTMHKPSPPKKTLWEKALSQLSIQDWNSLILEREERHILATINPDLPGFMKTVNFEEIVDNSPQISNYLFKAHTEARRIYKAKELKYSIQSFYQKKLQAAGYQKIQPTIHVWENMPASPACSIHPYIYVTSNFFTLPLKKRLSILAHEDQHRSNFHSIKNITITSFLDIDTSPDNFAQFTEKEADLKASAHSMQLALGLLDYFTEKQESNKISIILKQGDERTTHPSNNERIRYICDIVKKLQQEQKGYAWNPFYKTLGIAEWFKKNNHYK